MQIWHGFHFGTILPFKQFHNEPSAAIACQFKPKCAMGDKLQVSRPDALYGC